MKEKKNLSTIGLVLFGLGLLLGALYYGYAAWSDFEAYLFDPDNRGDTQLRSLSCPILISPGETGTVTVDLHNPTSSLVKPIVKAHISAGFITFKNEDEQILSLAPGETLRMQWKVTAEEAAWGRFVLVKVSSFAYPTPSQVGSCGVAVTRLLGLPGNVVVSLASILSLTLAVGGLLTWLAANRPLLKTRPINIMAVMTVLLVLLVAGVASSFFGWWIVDGFSLILSVLLLVVAGGYFIVSE